MLQCRRDDYLQWFSGSFGTCIMPVSLAQFLFLQIYRFGFQFARPIPELAIITKHMMEMIYGGQHHLFSRYNHNLLRPQNRPPKYPKYREKSSRPAVLRRRQSAIINVVNFECDTAKFPYGHAQ